MKLSDVMTSTPTTVAPDTTMATCRQRMKDLNVHHLPVVEDDRIVGLVNDVHALSPRLADDTPAGSVASRVMPWGYADEPLFDVLGRYASTTGDACLVRDRGDGLVGILTERDLVRLTVDLVEPTVLVDEVASTGLRTIEADTPLSEVSHRMSQEMARHLVATENGHLVGVVTPMVVLRKMDPRCPVRRALADQAPVTVRWGTTLVDVARHMREADVDAAVVVSDEDGRIAEGLVTVTDLLRALRKAPRVATD